MNPTSATTHRFHPVHCGAVVVVDSDRFAKSRHWTGAEPKPRPCWVATDVDCRLTVFPLSKQLHRSPVHLEPHLGGLWRVSAFIPTLLTLSCRDAGPAIGWVKPEVVEAALDEALSTYGGSLYFRRSDFEAAHRHVATGQKALERLRTLFLSLPKIRPLPRLLKPLQEAAPVKEQTERMAAYPGELRREGVIRASASALAVNP